MSTFEIFLAWIVVMFPLVFSPGPANIVFAASGANVGFRRSMPLLIGIDLVFVIYSLLIGFGVGAVVQDNPGLMQGLQLAGSAYLLYLAYQFIRPQAGVNTGNAQRVLGFWDGVVIQLFNPKGLIMLLLMFSLFSPSRALFDVLMLCFWLFVLNVTTHMVWIAFGSQLLAKVSHKVSQKYQGILFALCLLAVSIWIGVDVISSMQSV